LRTHMLLTLAVNVLHPPPRSEPHHVRFVSASLSRWASPRLCSQDRLPRGRPSAAVDWLGRAIGSGISAPLAAKIVCHAADQASPLTGGVVPLAQASPPLRYPLTGGAKAVVLSELSSMHDS
jgi:hypothetical protein